jgi:iron complex transport system substrate-binding protein
MREHLSATSAKLVAKIVDVCLLALLVATACGSAPSGSAAPNQASFPVTIRQSDGSTITLTSQPRRIVSLSPTATEMLFAIGADKQVVAVDDQSNYPPSAPTTKLSGFQPNVEPIAGYSPDLVIASDDPGGLVRGLASVNVPALLEPAATVLDDSYAQIRQLGTATGHVTEASALVTKMKSAVASEVAAVGKPTRPIKVYHELDNTYYSVTSHTFIGQVYSLLGLLNIADKATGAAPDYPQLSSEFIVSSDPDLIVLADTKCCQQTVQTVAARPGWQALAAVKSGQVVGVDDDIASRWGPRVVDLIRVIAARVVQLEHLSASVGGPSG